MWITDYDESHDKVIRDWEEFESFNGPQRDHTDDIFQTYSDGIPDGDEDSFLEMQSMRGELPPWEWDAYSNENAPY